MKKVIGMLALLALVGNIANAELLKNFKYDGKIEVNAISASNSLDFNKDTKDTTSDVNARVQLNASFDLAEDVEAVVSAVKGNRQYGDASESVAAGTADGFMMEQAYLNLKGVLGIDHKIGRQYYGEEGDLVLYAGPKSWPYMATGIINPMSVSGFDAYTGWYKTEMLEINVLIGKAQNANTDTGIPLYDRNPDTDTDLVGVAAKYSLMEPLNIGAYFYEMKDYTVGTPDLTKDVVGVKAMGKFMGFDYKGELVKNYGHQAAGKNYTGTAFLASAKYDIELVGKWSFMGEFGIGSGDDKTYAADKKINTFTELESDYRTGVIYGGVFGSKGLGDLTTWNLGATWNTPMFEKLTLGGKMYHFSPTVTKVNNTAAGAAKTDIGYDTYGNELDLCATWQHNESVGLKAYYAMFMVDGDYADSAASGLGGNDDMVTAVGAALTVKF